MDLVVEKSFLPGYVRPTKMGAFAVNLKRIREARGWKGKDLAERGGFTASQVSRWENDDINPDGKTLERLALALEVSVDELLRGPGRDQDWQGGTGESDVEPYDRDISRGYKKGDVPVIGDAEASTSGFIAWSDEGIVRAQVENWVSRSFADGDPKAYALRVRNDSMVPRYRPGEIVVAQPRLPCRDGDYAVVILKTGERLVKRVFRRDGGWILHSENGDYPDRDVADSDVGEMHRIKHSIHP